MYYDDPYDVNEMNDYDTEPSAESVAESLDSISVTSDIKKRRKLMDEYKKIDKGYHKVYRTNSKHKKVSVEFYETSSTPGNKIRNAITGGYEEKMRVGSKYENLFFKVKIATGETGKDGGSLYFDTPEQYERHFHTTVSQPEKEVWQTKFMGERLRLENMYKK
jgi:membrane-associated HD superfamily phosphohydrolase